MIIRGGAGSGESLLEDALSALTGMIRSGKSSLLAQEVLNLERIAFCGRAKCELGDYTPYAAIVC